MCVPSSLEAIAMPKGVFVALRADHDQCNLHLVHDMHVISHRLACTLVAESAKWMDSSEHKCWHWLHCSLPTGRCNLTDLKLSHPPQLWLKQLAQAVVE